MAPAETKKSKKITALTLFIFVFVAVQLYMITFRQDDLWMAWWLGVPIIVYPVMTVLILLRVVVALKSLRRGLAVAFKHGLVIVVCGYALWTMYQSYTVFAPVS